MPKFVGILQASTGVALTDLETALTTLTQMYPQRVQGPVTVRSAVRFPWGREAIQTGLGTPREITIAPLNAVLEVSLEEYAPQDEHFSQFLQFAHGALAALEQLIDRQRSPALAGVNHLVIPGIGRVLMALALHHNRAHSPDDSNRWWAESHATLVLDKATPFPLGYHPLHADPDFSHRVADALGLSSPAGVFDIWDSLYVPSVEFFQAAATTPDTTDQVKADEMGNVEMSGSCGAICRVL